eukprot:932928-Amphidinium_carterae.1
MDASNGILGRNNNVEACKPCKPDEMSIARVLFVVPIALPSGAGVVLTKTFRFDPTTSCQYLRRSI